jgi:CubicO group peptidase (beta-lactamase class C family)
MTLRRLLSHHAGFTHEAPIGNNYDTQYPSFEAYVESISSTWLRYPVGQRHSYANLGVDLSGYILGTRSNSSFPEYMRERVLEPLGMAGSSFDWDVIRDAVNRAQGHWAGYDSVPLTFALIPSGGLYSNAEDMAAVVRFHLNGGRVNGRVLVPPELLDQMYDPQFAAAGQIMGYGLGLRRYLRYDRYHFNHNGAGFGFQAHMAWYPEYAVGIVVLTNSMGHNLTSSLPYRLVDRVLKTKLGSLPRPGVPYQDLTPIDVPASVKHRFLGTYIGRGADLNLVMRGDTLGAWFGEQLGFREWQFTSRSEAFVDFGANRWLVRFVFDSAGRPTFFRRANDGLTFDYNDGPNDPPGPDKTEWNQYEGTYVVSVWDQRDVEVTVHRKNGYLYFNEARLEEYRPGLFFSTGGEALDLRGDPPTWRNIKLRRSQP